MCEVSWGVLACSPRGSLDLRCLQRKDASKQLAAPAEASVLVPGTLSLLYNKFGRTGANVSREEFVDLVKTKSLEKALSGL